MLASGGLCRSRRPVAPSRGKSDWLALTFDLSITMLLSTRCLMPGVCCLLCIRARHAKQKLSLSPASVLQGTGQEKKKEEEEKEKDEEAKELELRRAEEEAEVEEGRAGLYGMLLQLCSELHKHLRPRVFHGTDMDTLCEVRYGTCCTVFKYTYMPA